MRLRPEAAWTSRTRLGRQVYFSATIEISPEELARIPNAALYPGMPVDVAIVTGERTLLAYLLQPFTDSFAHAFREE